MKAVIIDDEDNARITLSLLIQQHAQQLTLVGAFPSLDEATKFIREEKPHVVFLDVQMPGESGLALWKYFPQPDFDIVITTAHHQYALQAIRLSALDYLLKPIDIDDLTRVVQKVIQQSSSKRIGERLTALEANLATASFSQIVLHTHDSLIVVKLADILRCESDNNYTRFFLINGTQYLVSKPLKEYESLLPSTMFCRIHQSHLVNLKYVSKYIKGKAGTVELVDGNTLPVSKERKEWLISMLDKI